jgi:hypothetical protein
MKVLIVVITSDYVEDQTKQSILAQDYPGVSSLEYCTPPKVYTGHFIIDLYRNCAAIRSEAREIALAYPADYYLFMDSDIVLPPHAVSEFLKQMKGYRSQGTEKVILGGWYRVKRDFRWVCGKWIADHTFFNYTRPEPSLIATDVVGMGCCFLSKAALQELYFEHGCDLISKTPDGSNMIVGECAAFGNLAAGKGYAMYMDGDVVCGHIERTKRAELENKQWPTKSDP